MRRERGQSTGEYAILFGVVIAAVVAMQLYVKRGAQAQLKMGVDVFTKAGSGTQTGGQSFALSSSTSQYEPYYAKSYYKTLSESKETENIDLSAHTIVNTIDVGTPELRLRQGGGYQEQVAPTTADGTVVNAD